jgi:ABC-2 type transport system ATP-binding protein
LSYAETIINKLQLDPSANLKRMSKGMKQKTAIVAALMADPDILILDEPTTGLDPLMRSEFIAILKEEKKRGKTIFMTSHMFEEVEQTCDKVAFIKEGKIIAVKPTDEIKHHEDKVYQIQFTSHGDYLRFLSEEFGFANKDESKNQVTLNVHDSQINALFKALKRYDVKSITEIKYTLEKYFKSLY